MRHEPSQDNLRDMLNDIVVREIDEKEKHYWDENIQTLEQAHPLNAYNWGQVRKIDGWIPIHLVAEKSGKFTGAFLLLKKKLPFLPYCIFYGPKGPVCNPKDRKTIQAIHWKLLDLARKYHAIFLRIDPNIREEEAEPFEHIVSDLKYVHLEQRWTYWNSPRDVYRIDLGINISCDDLLNSLDRDTRRCIRKAKNDGVIVEPALDEEDLKKFYNIFKEFSITKGFMVRGYEYQKKLWENYVVCGRGRLFLAKYEGEVIGGLICICFGKKCLAMHMGTPYKYQKLQTYYAYVWESIRWAKENGCIWYSFRGIGTTPTQEAFKRKFNPKAVALVGYYDIPFRPLLYKLFYWAEFTLLPASWPLIIKTRKLLIRMIKRLSH